MLKKIIVGVIILSVVIGIPLARKHFKADRSKAVDVEKVTMHSIKASILASGQLIHETQVQLSSEVIGKVTQLFVAEGDTVKKGQLVLTIDDENFKAAVEQQQAAVDQQLIAIDRQKKVLENLQSQWYRKKDLFEHKLLDKDAYEALTNQYEVAKIDLKGSYEQLKQVQATLDQSKDRLSKTQVVSPIDGTITSLDIKQGETAISGTTNIAGSSLMTIADPNTMLAEVNVDEADIAHVELGQQAEIIAISYPGQSLTGVVESIASSAKIVPGRQSLSFSVKLKLVENDKVNLRPGMSCRAEVFTEGDQSLLSVPVRSIIVKEDKEKSQVKNFVFTYDNGSTHKVEIETGISDDDFQQITSGLAEGQSIITGPDKILRHLKDGDKVVKNADSTQPKDKISQ
ncbi:MAG: efflux transporter periplasmic adaptor subunit [Gammaproteobacteria bacterium CG22_combo_CG10-13_8_21_14_all_40_8]|nr:MAG: efflux transporter periplasmic adaptor subunit [Gammaproteobacteria bacterium CG22_combo_CG10-13_8_21_14_all_40_8]